MHCSSVLCNSVRVTFYRGKNYADEMSREQFLAIMDLKTTIKERDLKLAKSCVTHLISCSTLPILHYFALSIA